MTRKTVSSAGRRGAEGEEPGVRGATGRQGRDARGRPLAEIVSAGGPSP
jgi:hypothetical protein